MIILKMEMEMIQILLIEGVFLCIVFWGVCWLGTGSDEKNIRNFSSYPRAVQKIVSTRPELAKKFCNGVLWPSSQTICCCLAFYCLRWEFLLARKTLQETF